MAENKKSFLLYADLIHTVDKLPDDYAGKLFKHLLQYVNDMNPETDDIVINIAFEPIKQSLKRDLIRWGETREKRSIAGKISAEKRNKSEHMLTHVEFVEQTSTNVNTVQQAVTNPTDNVNVNVSVINNNNVDVEHIDFDSLLILINGTFKRTFRTINQKNRQAFNARMKQGYKKTDIQTAILNCSKNDYHIENNFRYCTPEFFSRADVLDKYSNVTIATKQTEPKNAANVPCWNR